MRKVYALSKYLIIGILLFFSEKVNAQDYFDSDGRIIWDQSANTDYNFNVTHIGRDDHFGLNQKQATTPNTPLDITIGIKDIALSNSTNYHEFFADKTFLVWGHNNASTSVVGNDISKDHGESTGISTIVTATPIQRVWKLVVTDSIPSIKISIPETMVSITNSGSANYIMIIADNDSFTTNVTSATMTRIGDELQTNFYFEGTKYVTFGATTPISNISRAATFNGNDMYLDAGDVNELADNDFTISAWVKRNNGQSGFDILSKRDAYNTNNYTHGYSLNVGSDNKIKMEWKDPDDTNSNSIVSLSILPENQWHHVAVTFNKASNTTNLYINGHLENSSNTLNPMSTPSDAHFLIGAAHHINRQQHYNGSIDEVRIWSIPLSQDQIRYMMNQEITNSSNLVDGKVLPSITTKNDINTINWDKLIAYYPMNSFVFGSVKDASSYSNDASMINYEHIEAQTAPLPYKTAQDGNWDDPETWVNGDVQYFPGTTSNLGNSKTIDHTIVEINHNVNLNNTNPNLIPTTKNGNRTVLGLIVNSDLQIIGSTEDHTGFALTISHYLKLNGTIDLEGESQLIQTADSYFDPTSTGILERDQQGTANTYKYNHWSSPVAPNSNTNYTTNNVITNVGFLTYGYNGTTSPVKNADYWIWKYANNSQTNQSQWQHVRSSGTISSGQGFTMKGPGTSGTDQNYVFRGQPNNGNISLTIAADNDYLVGNPYPSAINADAFIKDNLSTADGGNNPNGNIISGTLYFWNHFALNSHHLAEYQGGHAMYTLMGGVQPINNDARINAEGAFSHQEIPSKYINIGEGFFVSSILDSQSIGNTSMNQPVTGGDILFKNSQRVFQKENTTDNSTDNRQRIRIMVDTPDGYHRQLLVGVDGNASNDFDIGYDGLLIENNKEDIFWKQGDSKLIIQAVNNFNNDQILPLGTTINKSGTVSFGIDQLENIEEHLEILLHDKEQNVYHNLKESNYETSITSGEHLNRFELTFNTSLNFSLSNEDLLKEKLHIYYANDKGHIIVENPDLIAIESIQLFSILGEQLFKQNHLNSQNYTTYKTPKLSSGTYIISLTANGKKISKKAIIK